MSTAVVLTAYGSPQRLDDIPASDSEIRAGRPIVREPGALARHALQPVTA